MNKIKLNIESGTEVISKEDWNEGWDMVSALAEDSIIDESSSITGKLSVPVACKSEVEKVNHMFDGLVEVDSTLAQFEDKEVLKVIAEKVGGGDLASTSAFNGLTSVGTWFKGNTTIESFEELEYTKISRIPSNGCFNGCSNLKKLKLPKTVTTIGGTGDGNIAPFAGTSIEEFDCEDVITYGNNAPWEGMSKLKRIFNTSLSGSYGGSYQPSIQGCTSLKLVYISKIKLVPRLNSTTTTVSCVAFFPSATYLDAWISNPNFKLIDVGNVSGIGNNNNNFKGNLVLRVTNVPSIGSGSNLTMGGSNKIFVPAALLEDFQTSSNTVWSSTLKSRLYDIGGTVWQSTMRTLAEQYAAEYAGWSSEQIANANYSGAYIDYDIFGVDRSTAPYVLFDDPEVERVLLANATHADANTITKEELGKITSVGTWFKNNASIVSFNELSKTKVTSFDEAAFANSSIEEVDLSNVKYLNRQTFDGCKKLRVVKGTENIVGPSYQFASNMFRNCSSLTNLNFQNLKQVLDGTFDGLSNLKTINLDSLENASNTTSWIAAKLDYLYLPSFKNANGSLCSDSGLNCPIIMLPSVTDYLMSGYRANSYVLDIGKNVSNMPNPRFAINPNYTSMGMIVVRATVPPAVTGTMTRDTHQYVFVPSESVSDYKAANGWSTLSSIIKPIGGSEWVSKFGSADEYADITKYVADEAKRAEIINVYRNPR